MPDAFRRNAAFECLHPVFRQAAQELLRRLAADNIPFRLFEGFRSPERQAYLYSQGRTRPGNIVTHAPPWRSYHQYGAAADFVLFENGTWSWDTLGARRGWWLRLGEVGRELGLEPLSFEVPHLQLAGLQIGELAAGRYPEGGDPDWADCLEAAIAGWTGHPSAPPPPPCMARPALSSDAVAPPITSASLFSPGDLVRTVILEPLLGQIKNNPELDRAVIIEVNQDYRDGRDPAIARIQQLTTEVLAQAEAPQTRDRIPAPVGAAATLFLKARLSGRLIRHLVIKDEDAKRKNFNAIHRVWLDFEIHPLICKSVATVKADAARIAFLADGRGITWAVLDSGIDKNHAHFQEWKNLDPGPPLAHKDFTGSGDPLCDELGHGTHVAGIIAGGVTQPTTKLVAVHKTRNAQGEIVEGRETVERILGMAPACSLLSFKVLDAQGRGQMSNILAALDDIQKINDYGRRLLIHGINLSVGYDFDPEWFACGQSPLCVGVNGLVKSGVVVVVAAGNTGYGFSQSKAQGLVAAGLGLTINDPGNADLAITVGSTHRYMPHVYGVSYFSSKGPTGDGRCKPDLVAPGEKILSCAAGHRAITDVSGSSMDYVEDSGTSMAAPHVSGVIAAFLSVRSEFIGRPEELKRIFMTSATDLGRDRAFQGSGLVDLMRAIQST